MKNKLIIIVCLLSSFIGFGQADCGVSITLSGEIVSENLIIREADIPSVATFSNSGYSMKYLSRHIFKGQTKFVFNSLQISSKYCDNFDLERFVKKYSSLLIRVYYESKYDSLAEKSVWIPISKIKFTITGNSAYLDFGLIEVN